MATTAIQEEQKSVCSNPSTNTIFFEDQSLAYNYKTGQWTYLAETVGNKYFSVQTEADQIGVMEKTDVSYPAYILWDGDGGAASEATFVLGDKQINPEGRALVDGIRPITNGATSTSTFPRVGVKDVLSDSVTWVTAISANSRTGMHNFRGSTNTPEGRYHRAEFRFDGGFSIISGAEFSFIPAGEV